MLLQFEDIEEVERFMKIFPSANTGGISDAEFDNFSNGLGILNDNVKHLENEFTQLMNDFERKGKGLHLAHKYIMELQEDMKKVKSNIRDLTIMCETNHDDLLLLKDPKHNEKVQARIDKIHASKEDNEVKLNNVKNNPDDLFTVNPKQQILFNNVKINETGHITHTTKQGYSLDFKISLPCLLYLNEVKNDLTFKQFNKLYSAIGSNYNYLSKVIYNLRVGTFDEIMGKFCENSKNIDVRIRKDNTLIINDNLTGLKANDAYELLLSIQSKGNRKLFSQIRQAYKGFKHLNIDEFLFYSLCINYNNSRILNVLKPKEKETPVVNDPSKRKSLGMM